VFFLAACFAAYLGMVQFNSAKYSGTRQAAKHTVRRNTTHQLQHTSASKEPAYILKTEDSSFLIKRILTPDDGHIGRNM
jgi:hypothetical protein